MIDMGLGGDKWGVYTAYIPRLFIPQDQDYD